MKIAIFFLLVGLYSCNGHGPFEPFAGTVPEDYAVVVGTEALDITNYVAELQGKSITGNDKYCIMHSFGKYLKHLSCYCGVEYEIMVEIVIKEMESDCETKDDMRTALLTGNYGTVIHLELDLEAIMTCMHGIGAYAMGEEKYTGQIKHIVGSLSGVLDSDVWSVVSSLVDELLPTVSGLVKSLDGTVHGLLGNVGAVDNLVDGDLLDNVVGAVDSLVDGDLLDNVVGAVDSLVDGDLLDIV